MRRRDFAIGLLLAAAAQTGRAQEPAKQHRIAIVISTGPVARVHDPTSRAFQAFWEELHRLGDAEGQNLIVDLYSGEERPAGFADLARRSSKKNPEVIVAIAGPMSLQTISPFRNCRGAQSGSGPGSSRQSGICQRSLTPATWVCRIVGFSRLAQTRYSSPPAVSPQRTRMRDAARGSK